MKKGFLILVALFIAAGCGTNMFEGMEDKNTTEATASEVIMKLDSGNYDWVLANPDKANATDYAAAAMGAAGLNPTELVNALNDIAVSVTQNDLGAVTSISIDTSALDKLQTAKEKLTEELLANPGDPDLSFQMVLTSITSTITAIAKVGEGNVTNFDPSNGIDTTEATLLGNYIAANPGKQVDTDGDDSPDTSLLTVIAEDVGNAVVALPDANLGASDLNEVLTDVTQGQGSLDYDGDGTVENTAISDYLNNVLGQ